MEIKFCKGFPPYLESDALSCRNGMIVEWGVLGTTTSTLDSLLLQAATSHLPLLYSPLSLQWIDAILHYRCIKPPKSYCNHLTVEIRGEEEDGCWQCLGGWRQLRVESSNPPLPTTQQDKEFHPPCTIIYTIHQIRVWSKWGMQDLLMCHSPDEKSIIIIHHRHIPCFARK